MTDESQPNLDQPTTPPLDTSTNEQSDPIQITQVEPPRPASQEQSQTEAGINQSDEYLPDYSQDNSVGRKKNKKVLFLVGGTLLVLVVLVFSFIGWFKFSYLIFPGMYNSSPIVIQRDFNFIYKPGIFGIDEMNTYTNIYTKDMVSEEAISTRLIISEKDMNRIKEKTEQINFDKYKSDCSNIGEPYVDFSGSVYLKVENKGKIKIIECGDSLARSDENLNGLFILIDEVIESNNSYKRLPEPTSGYL